MSFSISIFVLYFINYNKLYLYNLISGLFLKCINELFNVDKELGKFSIIFLVAFFLEK